VNLYSLLVYIEHNGDESPKVRLIVCWCPTGEGYTPLQNIKKILHIPGASI